MKENLSLSLNLSKRELLTRYKGSLLGFFWVFLSPLLLLALYSAVFQYIFKAKWDVSGEELNFTIALFCGLSPYFFLTELMGKSSELIKNNGNLVKKVVFNRLVLPFSTTLSSLFTLLVNFSLLLIASQVLDGNLSMYEFLVFFYLIPLFFIGFGLSVLLSCLGAYFKDLSNIVNFINPVLMFISPIFFSADKVSPIFNGVIHYNPLTHIINGIRSVVLHGNFNISNFMTLTLLGLIMTACSIFLFRRLEEDFSDLI
ncbi:ABC transporter permease [Psychromonas sp. SR45-3]|uniref:ABC transporter permease n=1 Tax=Psychromonas sp. SR45-3 TaxID=2760930 RepID=UPI0015FBDB2C|nr:ABC transporter permease [Psychromonas sp. SR45-3]MBB1272809.1 ABC transporter permease [Psychromonas sp. SR45-3]